MYTYTYIIHMYFTYYIFPEWASAGLSPCPASARCGLRFCHGADVTGTVHGDATDVAGQNGLVKIPGNPSRKRMKTDENGDYMGFSGIES
jgi:hypothetical protein